MKSEHPGLSIGEVAKKLGELWNNTSSEDKQPYEKKASKLKEKYEKVRSCQPSSGRGGLSLSLTFSPCPIQDVAAYRQKTKGGTGSAGKAPAKAEKKPADDDDDDDDDEEEEEDDDDDDDE